MWFRGAAVVTLSCFLSALLYSATEANSCFPQCRERRWSSCVPDTLLPRRANAGDIWGRSEKSGTTCILCNKRSSSSWVPPGNTTCFQRKVNDSVAIAVRGHPFGRLSARKLAFVEARTTALALMDNNITSLEPRVLARLSFLQLLHLDCNRLSVIQTGWFSGLDELEDLTLTNNRIRTVAPGSFRELRRLKTLYLEKNLLHTVRPGWFAGLANLWDLHLGQNRLESISLTAFRSLGQLVRLDLQGNLLSSLDGRVLSELDRLETAKIEGDRLATLDGWAVQTVRWGLTLYHPTYPLTEHFRTQYVSVSVQGCLICFHRDETRRVFHLGWMVGAPDVPYCVADSACRCTALDRALTKTAVRLPVVLVVSKHGRWRKLTTEGRSIYMRASATNSGIRLQLKNELSFTLAGLDEVDNAQEASVVVISRTGHGNGSPQLPTMYVLVPNAETTTLTAPHTVSTEPNASYSTHHDVASTFRASPNSTQQSFKTSQTRTQQTTTATTIRQPNDDGTVSLGVLIVIVLALIVTPSLLYLMVMKFRKGVRCNAEQHPRHVQNSAADCVGPGTWPVSVQHHAVQQTDDGASSTDQASASGQIEYRVYWGISNSGQPTVSVTRLSHDSPQVTHDNPRVTHDSP
ncbi:PREDICTED: uncharacterized protein LOC109462061 [Branchiostoma belcheri]|uniref:Uncharacterized protein LOC109462061 n=1 Tax=Branchiostoma belcheri TaxID=7741 RepID=A0A6P4Y5Y8_BRABE|nr:PREDICTED: uncharacterized protein LOC109462061 [Branchiostoma belcheri]